MAFPQAFLDELLARNDIVDVVGSYVHLTNKGSNLFGLCPFHNEKTGSFSVSPEKQIYYCFGCHKGGGVINFIMEEEGLSYPDAIHFLAQRVGMTVPEDDNRDANRARQRLLDLNREAALFYHQLLNSPQGENVRQYLEKRSISRKIAVRFGMGASSPDSWDSLMQAMVQKGYTKAELLSAGLISQGKNGRVFHKFRNRLILPVVDVRGDVVGFGSRVIDNSEPKYMNTQETPVYSKRRVLYGLNLAKKSKRPNIILCEGNLDVVTLHQAGFDNAVASMGTSLTEEQIRLLSRYTKELILCYDNDSAGQQATQRALSLLNNTDFSVKVLQLPRRLKDGEYVKQDADDFIKFQGRDAFEALLTGSENGVEFRMAQIAGKYDLKDDLQKVAYSEEISDLLSTLENAVEREVYTNRAAEASGISPEALRLEIQRAGKRKAAKARREQLRKDLNPRAQLQPQERSMRYDNIRSAMAEEGLIRLFLRDESLFAQGKPIEPEFFSSPVLGKVYNLLWQYHAQGQHISLASLSAELTQEEMAHIVSVTQKPESTGNVSQALQDYTRIIQHEYTKRSGSDGIDPLLAAQSKYTAKKGYGGNQHG